MSIFSSNRDPGSFTTSDQMFNFLSKNDPKSIKYAESLSRHPEILMHVVDLLTPHKFAMLLLTNTDTSKKLAFALRSNLPALKKILKSLSASEICDILNREDHYSDSVCFGLMKDNILMQIVVEKVSPEQIIKIAMDACRLAEAIASSPQALKEFSSTQILQMLSEEANSSSNFISYITNHPESLKVILNKLSAEQITELLTQDNDNSYSIGDLLERNSALLEIVVLKLSSSQLADVLTNHSNTRNILAIGFCRNSKVLNNLIDKLSPKELVAIFSSLTSENTYTVRDFFSDKDGAIKLVEKLSSEDLISIFTSGINDFFIFWMSSFLVNTKAVQASFDKMTTEQLLQVFRNFPINRFSVHNEFVKESLLPLYTKFLEEGTPKQRRELKDIFNIDMIKYASTRDRIPGEDYSTTIPANSEYGNKQKINVFKITGDNQRFFAIQIGEASQQQYMLIGSIEKVAQLMEKYGIPKDSPNGIAILNATESAFTLPEKSPLVEL